METSKLTKSQLLEHIFNYYKLKQDVKDLDKKALKERNEFEEHVIINYDGYLRIGNFEVSIAPCSRTLFDLDFASKALAPDIYDRYIKPYLITTDSSRLSVKKI